MAAKKRWIWFLGALVLLAGLLIAGWHFFKKDLAKPDSKIAKPLLTDKLKKFLNKASNGMYQMEYDRFDLNLDAGSGLITNFKLIADTAVYHRLLAGKKAPNNVLWVQVDSLIIKKFGFVKTDTGRRFNIAAITIKNLHIVATNKRQPYNDTIKPKQSVIKGLLKDLLKHCDVEQMVINNMTFTYVNKNEERVKHTTLKRWNMRISGLSLADLDATDEKAKQNGAVNIKRFVISTPDSLYRLIFSDMRFNPQQGNAYMRRFVLQPRLGKVAFYRKSTFNRDRLHFIYDRLSMKKIDIDRVLRRQQLHIQSMSIGKSWTEIYNNYHFPQRLRPQRRLIYPQQRLQLLAFDITIDTMKMQNGYFRYAIAAKKSKRTASLYMTNISSRIYHVTTNTLEKKKNPFLTSNTRCLMMGVAPLRVKYVFNLVDKNGAFSTNMHMGAMDARAINPVAKPLGLMEAKAGVVNRMDMQLTATNRVAKGNIDLYYKGLKINWLKRDDGADTLKKRGFLSFVTNTVMPDDNPKKNGKFRKGPIYIIRDPRLSFFGLLWKATQDGMSSAVMGIDQKKDKPDENIAIKAIKKIFKPLRDKKQLKKDKNKN